MAFSLGRSMRGRGGYTVADDSHSLISKVKAPIPSGRMHHFASEIIQARDPRIAWYVELTDGRYKEVGGDLVCFLVLAIFGASQGHLYLPLHLTVVPARFLHH